MSSLASICVCVCGGGFMLKPKSVYKLRFLNN